MALLEIEPMGENTFKVCVNRQYDITTTVTRKASVADNWIRFIDGLHKSAVCPLLVGLHVQRCNVKGNRIAVLQLCVGRRCLVFQIMLCDGIPDSLHHFLANFQTTFCGVGVTEHAGRLQANHGLKVRGIVQDLRILAANIIGMPEFEDLALEFLAKEVLFLEIAKPPEVENSNWDQQFLTLDQIKYACAYSFLSFEIGRRFLPPSFDSTLYN